MIAAQVGAWAQGTPAAATPMPAMDCECPPSSDPCPPQKDDNCALDPGCMARCTFIQPAITGPTGFWDAQTYALTQSFTVRLGLPQRGGALPFRPPKSSILV